MSYQIKSLKYFKEQFDKLDEKSKRIIHKKIQLIKENPFRSKRIHSKSYSKVFRIRLKINFKEKRLIYVILSSNVILVCLLDRDKNYKDLEKYLSRLK